MNEAHKLNRAAKRLRKLNVKQNQPPRFIELLSQEANQVIERAKQLGKMAGI